MNIKPLACLVAAILLSVPPVVAHAQEGKASWYGPGFQGRLTASGERFDTNDYTAAHKTIPFGSTVRVENLENGKWLVVRINDRGPFVKGRILDVSFAAAEYLGILKKGTASVRISSNE